MKFKVFYFGTEAVRVPDAWDVVRVRGRVYQRRRDAQGRHAYWVSDTGQTLGGRGVSSIASLMLALLLAATPVAAQDTVAISSYDWTGPVAPLPSSKPSKWPSAALVIVNALDSVSTEIALQQPGLREVHPLGQSRASRMAIKAVTNVAEVWLVWKIGKRHPTAAKWFGYGISAATTVVAVRNYRIARQLPR